MIKTVRIEPQTYRIGDYVAFQLDDLSWKLGKPVDWMEPIGGGLEAGTVTYHRTLRDCRSAVRRRAHMKRELAKSHLGPDYRRAF